MQSAASFTLPALRARNAIQHDFYKSALIYAFSVSFSYILKKSDRPLSVIFWGHFLLAQKTGLSAIPLSLHPPRRLRLLRWIASLRNALAPIPCLLVGFESKQIRFFYLFMNLQVIYHPPNMKPLKNHLLLFASLFQDF